MGCLLSAAGFVAALLPLLCGAGFAEVSSPAWCCWVEGFGEEF